MRTFLSGPMGSGKSTLGGLLAERTGQAFFDLDTVIEQREGATVPELFRTRGEAAFRELESSCFEALIVQHADCVVALGGGAVTGRELRHRALRCGTLVTLAADVDALVDRLGAGEGRPLLEGGDVGARLRELLSRRADDYAECHGRVDTGTLDEAGCVDAILALCEDRAQVVPLGGRSYRVEIGAGVRARLVERTVGASSVILVTDSVVGPLWGDALGDALEASGKALVRVTLPPGEAAKHVDSVKVIWEAALDAGIDRGAMVVGIGGGVVGDLSGFAAATLLRGIAVGHVPTTLLSMVDSSIGGKTGFDTSAGKNLVGAFHQPSFVLADVEVLETLAPDERRAGLAEVAKSAWLEGEAEVAQLEADAAALLSGERAATERAIRMSCAMKARVVTQDERESGVRALLNLGHTVGHAIEASRGFDGIRHGEAVSLGMVAACRLATRTGRQREQDAVRLRTLLEQLGLPVELDAHLDATVVPFLSKDKKMRGGTLGFVVPGAPGQAEVVPTPVDDVVSTVWPSRTP